MPRHLLCPRMAYWWEVASLLTTSCVTLLTLVVNGLTSEIFGIDVEEVSNEFYTQITPSGYTFAIWAIIYMWQILWLGYAWSFVFRPKAARTISGVYWSYALVNCCNIVWMYLCVNKLLIASLVVFILLDVFLYVTIWLLWVHFCSARHQSEAVSRRDYWLTWALPINGLLCYTTWGTLAVFINLAIVLQYSWGLDSTTSATVSLVLLTLLLLAYIMLENTTFRRFTVYAFSVYPVVIWALIGILVAHWNAGARNAIYVLVLLLAIIVYVVIKTIRRLARAKLHDS